MSDHPSIPSGTDSPALEKGARNHGQDPVWDLLAKDAKVYPVEEPDWFATRITAMALQTPQQSARFGGLSFHLKWWMPIPLAGVAALALLLHAATPALTPSLDSNSPEHSLVSNTSEKMFEQHMEMLASSYSSDGTYQ